MQVRVTNAPNVTPPANWPEELQQEILRNVRNGCVGRYVLSENARVRVWRLDLDPGERLGFHCHVLDYFHVALTAGTARSLDHHGNEDRYSFDPGQVKHVQFQEKEFLLHDLENVGSDPFSVLICEHLRSANAPLPIPDHVRVKPRHIEEVHWAAALHSASTT
ncbi:hypothetical protein [Mameliella sediminis]|uniref:hypothetical protein n=1 Tax=Mameliella sediminis TaxID=2836866 RepID=UPI001C473EC9|nr:hypothetical protein [Mameliella sediminis]MBV7395380.1 hypothetical protein [Mameliella sediminis]